MSTYIQKPSNSIEWKCVVFSNHPDIDNPLTFAAGDIIDVKSSLNRPSKKCKIILNGAVTVRFYINPFGKSEVWKEASPNEILVSELDQSNLVPLVLRSTGSGVYEYDFDFPIEHIVIEDISITTSTTNFLQFIFMNF